MLAIWGARHRQDTDFRNIVTSAWLGGMLSQCPPAQYPTLEKLLGGEAAPVEPQKTDPAEASANARAWGVWLRAGQKKRKGKP